MSVLKPMVAEVVEPVQEEAQVFELSCAVTATLVAGALFGCLAYFLAHSVVRSPSRRGSEAREVAHLLTTAWKRGRLSAEEARVALCQYAQQYEIPQLLQSGREGAIKLLRALRTEACELDASIGATTKVKSWVAPLRQKVEAAGWASAIGERVAQWWVNSGLAAFVESFQARVEARYASEGGA